MKEASRVDGKSVCTVKSSLCVGCLLPAVHPTTPPAPRLLLLVLLLWPVPSARDFLTGRRINAWKQWEWAGEVVNVSRWATQSQRGRGFRLSLPVTHTCTHTHTLCFVTYHRVWFPNKMTLVKVCLIESWFKRSGSPTFCQGETSASCSPFHHCILPFCTALWTKPAEETCHNDAG